MGFLLDKILRERNISSYRIAKDMGLNNQTVINYRTGITTPSSKKLEAIAKYLNIPVESLLDNNNDSYKCETEKPVESTDLLKYLEKELEKKEEKIAELHREIGRLEAEIRQLEHIKESKKTDVLPECDVRDVAASGFSE